mgnify:CR=1 FL=1
MSLFLKSKRKRCRTGALLLLAGSVLTGTAPAIGKFSVIPFNSLTASAQELDIESIEEMQRDGQSETSAGGGTVGNHQNAETVDERQNVSSNSDTLAGYGKTTEDALVGDEQNAEDSLAGDGQNAESALAGDGQNTDIATQSESSFTDEKLSSVLAQIQTLLPVSNGDWSVYVCDLATGAEGTINDHRMQAASLIKLYIMGAVYENYDALAEQYGKDIIDADLYTMITVSDNDAANELTTCLGFGDAQAGMQIVNNYCLAHGYTTTSMGRLLLHSNEFGDNYTSVSNCGAFLKMVYQNGYQKKRSAESETADRPTAEPKTTEEPAAQSETADESPAQSETADETAADPETELTEVLTETDTDSQASTTAAQTAQATAAWAAQENASDMFALLCAQTRKHKIPAQLPDGVYTANKTGELDDVENDAAILYDTDNDLIIVFMSEHLGDCGAAQSTIASLSRQIYDLYH